MIQSIQTPEAASKSPRNDPSLQQRTEEFQRYGFTIARGLFTTDQVSEIETAFTELHRNGGVPGAFEPDPDSDDPLGQYPRFIHPHKHLELAKRYMIHPPVLRILASLLGEEVHACQSMYYYKPPKARGQALHQDNLYLLVEPHTCVAAWTAIDDCDVENGGMVVVPDTQDESIICPRESNSSISFTNHQVDVPKGKRAVLAKMKAGDTLFFNGSTIHGSGPNKTSDRFRRSFICHYVPVSTTKVSNYYLPLTNAAGEDVWVESNDSGGPCGDEWMGQLH